MIHSTTSLRRRLPLLFLTVATTMGMLPGCRSRLATEEDKTENIVAKANAEIAEEEAEKAAEQAANPKTQYSDDAFLKAAREGRIEIVSAALESGTDVNTTDLDGRAALQLAAFDGHTHVVKKLLQAGAEVNHVDSFGRSALMFASTGPYADTVRALLGAGASVNDRDTSPDGFTALMFAAGEGQTEVAKLLLDASADPTLRDLKDGESARDFAAAKGFNEVIELLDAALEKTKTLPDDEQPKE